jgi:large conductance mechanosensitive channel
LLKEFKDFALRGNAMDLAVAVIIGGAFGNIVSSLVEDIIMPIVGIFLGGVSFTSLQISLGEANFTYGMFIQSVVDFLIIAFVIFMMIRIINAARKKKEEPETAPALSREEELLTEIRDLLKAGKYPPEDRA